MVYLGRTEFRLFSLTFNLIWGSLRTVYRIRLQFHINMDVDSKNKLSKKLSVNRARFFNYVKKIMVFLFKFSLCVSPLIKIN